MAKRERFTFDPELGRCKVCCRCHEVWPADREFFGLDRSTGEADGLSYYCLACAAEIKRASLARRPQPATAHRTRSTLPSAHTRTVDGQTERRCSHCGQWHPESTAWFYRTGDGRFTAPCKPCKRVLRAQRWQVAEVAHG